MTSNFIMSGTEEVPGEFMYGRYGNPSRDALEATLAALEGAKYALAFSSGTHIGCQSSNVFSLDV
jgi:cystathionine beta-lyase/cystathionine gamma-synthase